MRMMLEKNRRIIKNPRMKDQKGMKLIGLKDKKVIVSMAIKALYNTKAFRTQKAKKAKKQSIAYRKKDIYID